MLARGSGVLMRNVRGGMQPGGTLLRGALVPVVLLMGALAMASAAHAETYSAALLPLMAPDLLEPQKRAIDERFRAIAADNGIALQPAAATASGIEMAKKAGAACNLESLACQAQMGVLLGTKQVIVARVASDWAGDRLELRLLDALRGTTLREATQLLPKDADLRARVADGVILAVLAPKKTGSLTLTAGEGSLFLDGVALTAQAAKAKIDGLAPGPHDVELRAEGRPAQHKRVAVIGGETVAVAIGAPAAASSTTTTTTTTRGPNAATDDRSSLALWLVGGGAAVAAAAGAGAGGLQAALEYSSMERPTRSALQITGISLLGATAIGVVVASAGGVMMASEQAP